MIIIPLTADHDKDLLSPLDKEQSFTDYAKCYNCYQFNNGVCAIRSEEYKPTSHCNLFKEKTWISYEEWIKEQNKPQQETKATGFKIAESLMVFNGDYLEMAEKFWEIQPYYYDKSCLWWLWNHNLCCWELVDETDLVNTLKKNASQRMQLTSTSVFGQIVRSLKLVGRDKKPKEAPAKWIQFKDKAFSLESGKIYDVTKDYFFTNPIPWEIGDCEDTPTMDKLLEEWVGKESIQTLYEIIAYCCLSDYPIHVLFCFIGVGCNGKSKFQQLLQTFIGPGNCCSTELDTLLDSRFESAKLYKKLVCSLGETNFGILSKTSLLKKLVGQDLIGYEYKNKNPFDALNYAKILINSNTLPVSEDNTEGFYRRWMIIDFHNKFKEGQDILKTIPEIEYNNLAKKVLRIIPQLIERGSFTNQGTVEDRRQRYILASNPLSAFLDKYCMLNSFGDIRASTLYSAYVSYLNKIKKRIITSHQFTKYLVLEGYEIQRTTRDGVNDRYVLGVCLKENWETNK